MLSHPTSSMRGQEVASSLMFPLTQESCLWIPFFPPVHRKHIGLNQPQRNGPGDVQPEGCGHDSTCYLQHTLTTPGCHRAASLQLGLWSSFPQWVPSQHPNTHQHSRMCRGFTGWVQVVQGSASHKHFFSRIKLFFSNLMCTGFHRRMLLTLCFSNPNFMDFRCNWQNPLLLICRHIGGRAW